MRQHFTLNKVTTKALKKQEQLWQEKEEVTRGGKGVKSNDMCHSMEQQLNLMHCLVLLMTVPVRMVSFPHFSSTLEDTSAPGLALAFNIELF